MCGDIMINDSKLAQCHAFSSKWAGDRHSTLQMQVIHYAYRRKAVSALSAITFILQFDTSITGLRIFFTKHFTLLHKYTHLYSFIYSATDKNCLTSKTAKASAIKMHECRPRWKKHTVGCTFWMSLFAHQTQDRLGIIISLLLARRARILAIVRQFSSST